jgi:hypothetical protein
MRGLESVPYVAHPFGIREPGAIHELVIGPSATADTEQGSGHAGVVWSATRTRHSVEDLPSRVTAEDVVRRAPIRRQSPMPTMAEGCFGSTAVDLRKAPRAFAVVKGYQMPAVCARRGEIDSRRMISLLRVDALPGIERQTL